MSYETSDRLKTLADQSLHGGIVSVDDYLTKIDGVTKESVAKVRQRCIQHLCFLILYQNKSLLHNSKTFLEIAN